MQQSSPLISVITVCRNNLDGLKRTLQSVAEQTYDPIEYIVVDGASTDGTQAYMQTKKAHIHAMVSEPDRGIYDAMNKGVGMARGEWVIFMNAGDRFAAPDTLSRIFAEPRQADVIYGDVLKQGKVKPALSPRNCHRMYFCHQSALVRRELLLSHLFDLNHPLSADFKLFKLLYLEGCSFCQLPFPVADFDTTGISNTSRSRGLKDNITVIKEVDSPAEQLRLLPRLYFTYLLCKLRKK